MNIGLYQAAAALNAKSRWQESIAQNLASSSIPGFKKQEISFGAVAASLAGPLKVVGFNNPALLTPISSGYFLANNPNVKAVPATPAFHQGYLEGSNTSPTTEMAHLITAMRMYEANQKVIQSQDERMNHAISELGGP